MVVWSADVTNPAAVRYAWADNWPQSPPAPNLFNKAGLPAGSFRTDDWPATTADIVAGGGGLPILKKGTP